MKSRDLLGRENLKHEPRHLFRPRSVSVLQQQGAIYPFKITLEDFGGYKRQWDV